jgi:hypothetical protein
MIQVESNKTNFYVFCNFLNDMGVLVRGKLVSTESVSYIVIHKIHCYEAAQICHLNVIS